MNATQKNSASAPRRTNDQMIANSAFFFLFPGFFFYHTLLGTGTTGAFLAGYFSPISFFFGFPLLIIAVRRIKRMPFQISYIELNYGVFLLYFLIIIFFNTIAGANRAIVTNHLLCILFMINTFIIFSVIDFSAQSFRILGMAALCSMSGIAFSYSVNGVFYLGALGVGKDLDSLATYQGFARSYLITFLPVIAFTRSLVFRLALYSIAISTLFVNTARSEFAALIFIIPFIELYFSRQKMLFLLAIILICVFIKLHMNQIMESLPTNRILELLDLSHSTSANKRHHLTMHALQTIQAHPLLGDYASYAPGYYSHNILSAWVDLGLFGFLYLIFILITPAIPMFLQEYFSGRRNGEFILGFSLACCTALLLLMSHYFTDMLIGATLGAYLQYHHRRKHVQYRTFDFRASTSRYEDIHEAMPKSGRTWA